MVDFILSMEITLTKILTTELLKQVMYTCSSGEYLKNVLPQNCCTKWDNI